MDKRKIILDCDPGHDDAVRRQRQMCIRDRVECVPISGAGYSGVRRMRTAHDTG